MNLASLNVVSDDWPPVQSQFFYNSGDMLRCDHLEKNHFEPLDRFSPAMSIDSHQEAGSESYYHHHYSTFRPQAPDSESNAASCRPQKSINFVNESTYCSPDTSNSNCPLNSTNVPNVRSCTQIPMANHSRRFSSFENCGEKKFVSEIHINFKDPKAGDAEPRPTCESTMKIGDNMPIQHGYHMSSFETFLAPQTSDSETPFKNNVLKSEIRSISPESFHRKSEYHHSEKFIFLGCDALAPPPRVVVSGRNSQETNNHSPTLLDRHHPTPLPVRLETQNLSKVFLTKAVQTLKQIDCIFKTTCDASVETDLTSDSKTRMEINPKREKRPEPINRTRPLPEMRVPSSDSRSEKESFRSENSLDKRFQKNRPRNIENVKKMSSKPVRKKERQSAEDNNQDTFTGSYSEVFSQSNELCESYVKERSGAAHRYEVTALRKTSKKTESTKKGLLKANLSALIDHKSGWKNKSKKNVVEKKEKTNDSKGTTRTTADSGRMHLVTKGDTDRHSLEIQCLLDNLNTRLQSTVNCHGKTSKSGNSKCQNNQFNNVGSFWDNPLNPETTRSLFLGRQLSPKQTSDGDRQKTINPEIQAIFESLERSTQNSDSNFDQLSRLNRKSSPSNIDLNMRSSHGLNLTQPIGDIASHHHSSSKQLAVVDGGLGSTADSFLQDSRFPPNLKFQKSFDLSPYDELVKSHLNSSDRRIKSVAAKNGCRIVIDGPISLVDPSTTCQAIRNKITFRCVVAGSSKDRLDKCLNYLKETFPNTYLRLHNRNTAAPK